MGRQHQSRAQGTSSDTVPSSSSDPALPPCPEHLEARWEAGSLAQQAQHGGPFALAFLGDSITEGLNSCGRRLDAVERDLGGPVGVFGVPGDTVGNLAWRLGHSGLPRATAYCIQIGTNDVWLGEQPRSVAAQIGELVRYVRAQHPTSHILLLGLFWMAEKHSRALAINTALCSYVAGAGDPLLHYSDAGKDLAPHLFPDGVHPEKAAYDQLLDALLPLFKQLLHDGTGGS